MLGWLISVYRVADEEAVRRTLGAEPSAKVVLDDDVLGGRLAVWQAGPYGLNWIAEASAFRINEQRELLNAGSRSETRQIDDRRRVDEPVRFIDDADVVDRNPLVFIAAEAPVHMSTDHDPRPHSLDRVQQLAASNVLDAASVKVERAVPVVQRRLMRHEDVDAFRNCRVHRLELARFLHERPAHEPV